MNRAQIGIVDFLSSYGGFEVQEPGTQIQPTPAAPPPQEHQNMNQSMEQDMDVNDPLEYNKESKDEPLAKKRRSN